MSPATHLLCGWAMAQCGVAERRDRALITIAGIAPDLDGLGAIIDFLTDYRTNYWGDWHHVLGHNLMMALLCMGAALIWGRQRLRCALLVLLSVHLHLLCDLIGGRGPASALHPQGYQWPMPYFYPFSDAWVWEWSGQWALNAWPNFAITGLLLAATFYWAWRRGHSPLEMVSQRADIGFVQTLRQRFGQPLQADS